MQTQHNTINWNIVHNFNVSAATSVSIMIAISNHLAWSLKYNSLIPACVFGFLHQIAIHQFHKNNPSSETNYTYAIDTLTNVGASYIPSLVIPLYYASAGFFPALSVGIAAGVATTMLFRLLASGIKACYNTAQSQPKIEADQLIISPDLEDHPPLGDELLIPEGSTEQLKLRPVNWYNLVTNTAASTGIVSAVGLELSHRDILFLGNTIALAAYLTVNFAIHAAIHAYHYKNQQPHDTREFGLNILATATAAFLPYAIGATFATVGFIPAICSVMVINVGAATATRVLTNCYDSLFNCHQKLRRKKEAQAALALTDAFLPANHAAKSFAS